MSIKRQWSIGGVIIVGAGILGVLSMFLGWVKMSSIPHSGIQQRTYFYLIFFIYPVIVTLMNYNMNKLFGYICGVFAMICGIRYIVTKETFYFGNISSVGPQMFTLSAVLLVIGVFKYKKRI
ncbi:MAG TPA: hypothetical protein PK566_17655 [Pseudobacteroides sp.]|nr:hypothetical protein [Pseudobacteroides sp.]